MPLQAFPVLGCMLCSAAERASPRRVERVSALAAASPIASAAHHQHLHEAWSRAAAAVPKAAWPAAEPPAPPVEPVHPRLAPATAELLQRLHSVDATLLIRVMVAAAQADGAIDGSERRRMFDTLHDLGGSAEERAFLLAQLEAPQPLGGIGAEVADAEQAVELYTAALTVIEIDSPAETAFLAGLARELGLDPQRVAGLHGAAGAGASS